MQTLYDACEEHDAYMSLCSVEDVQEDGKSCDPAYFTRPTQEGVFCGKDLLNEFYTPYGTVYTVAWNKMYRAEVWKLLHYPEGRLHEDDFVAHRLFWRCDKVVCIDKPLYHYRLRNGSICRTNIRPERSTPWTVWRTAIVFMLRTTRTARSSTRPMQPAGGGIYSSARRCASPRRPSWSKPSARSSF